MYAVCNFVMNISDFYVEKNGEIRLVGHIWFSNYQKFHDT